MTAPLKLRKNLHVRSRLNGHRLSGIYLCCSLNHCHDSRNGFVDHEKTPDKNLN